MTLVANEVCELCDGLGGCQECDNECDEDCEACSGTNECPECGCGRE